MRTTLKKLMPGNVFIHIHHLPKFKFGSLNKSDYLFFLGEKNNVYYAYKFSNQIVFYIYKTTNVIKIC